MLVITTALVVLYAFVTTRTVIGRQIYAVGTKAAKLSGIKTERLPARRGRVSLVPLGR
jgi:putative multiple sugar transport system permease protein